MKELVKAFNILHFFIVYDTILVPKDLGWAVLRRVSRHRRNMILISPGLTNECSYTHSLSCNIASIQMKFVYSRFATKYIEQDFTNSSLVNIKSF